MYKVLTCKGTLFYLYQLYKAMPKKQMRSRKVTTTGCHSKRKAYVEAYCRKSKRSGKRVRGGSLWSWIKDTALPWVKKNHLVSSGLGMLGPYGKAAGAAAGALGWGKRVHGGNFATDLIKKHVTLANLKKYNNIAREKRYVSKGLFKFGKKGSMIHNVGKAVHALGYGHGGSLGYGRGCQKKS
jgi:hypothetical protein